MNFDCITETVQPSIYLSANGSRPRWSSHRIDVLGAVGIKRNVWIWKTFNSNHVYEFLNNNNNNRTTMWADNTPIIEVATVIKTTVTKMAYLSTNWATSLLRIAFFNVKHIQTTIYIVKFHLMSFVGFILPASVWTDQIKMTTLKAAPLIKNFH